ncbi:hypothetical protein [Halobacillus aidingensis]|uniref:Uncharacterized protein n=1 Tax=Halobacillus aidingensis TaxID=240303 RepID=A0A1H0RKZ3_HALAD|nr:hypothetical protein [Halobacillus aidingensis]SDP30172.1 hypothetical protein SAMN05421677_11591 [Halobacillus aidingensis]
MTDQNSHELLMKQLMKQLLENQLQEVQQNDKGNSSFVFLENHTLNLLLLSYLTRNSGNSSLPATNASPPGDFSAAIQEVERMTEEGKEAFEEVITIMKERL